MNGSLDMEQTRGSSGALVAMNYEFCFFEAPGNKIAGVEGDAKEIGGNEAELRGANSITQTTALLSPATTQPCQSFLPISTVARTVKTQDR